MMADSVENDAGPLHIHWHSRRRVVGYREADMGMTSYWQVDRACRCGHVQTYNYSESVEVR